MQTNTYILYDDESKDAVLIDPGDDFQRLEDVLSENKLNCVAVLLTHAHFDHCNCAKYFQNKGAKVYLHSDDLKLIETDYNLAKHFGIGFNAFTPDVLLKDGDIINLLGKTFKVIHTPGHTAGSVCYMVEDNIFTGDTLFCLSRGRTDFPTGDAMALNFSIKKLYALSGDYNIYSGHGESTKLSNERRYNLA